MSARAPPCSGPGPRPCALLRDRDSEALRADLGPAAADLAQLLPELRQRVPDLPEPPALEPDQARFRLFDILATVPQAAAERQPLLLVLDDLHWEVDPSLLLLQFLAHELRQARLPVLGA